MHRASLAVAAAAAVGLALACVVPGCGDPDEERCETGDVQQCTCDGGGQGTQSCVGGDWGECVCASSDGDADADTDVDGDADSDADADVDGDEGSDADADVDGDGDADRASAFAEISARGNLHSCGLTTDGMAYCWGSDATGALGNGEPIYDSSTVPVAVDISGIGSPLFAHVAAGVNHSCAVSVGGAAFCWGRDANGQLGDGGGFGSDAPDTPAPVAVDTSAMGGLAFASVAPGGNFTCGLTTTGRVFCWGESAAGQLGNGNTATDFSAPVQVDATGVGDPTFAQLSAGDQHACGVTTEGGVYCWGSDRSGQLGDGGGSADSAVPVAVDVSVIGSPLFAQVSAGYGHSCALTPDGAAYCWGVDTFGNLGDGEAALGICNVVGRMLPCSQVPVAVDTSAIGSPAFAQITASCGGQHTCGVTTEGDVYCWGYDHYGQLGNGDGAPDICDTFRPTDPCAQAPVAVDGSGVGSPVFTLVSAGMDHTCAVAADGVGYCWGQDGGLLGHGDTTIDTCLAPDGTTRDCSHTPVAVDVSSMGG